MQGSAVVVKGCQPFSSMESSINASHINCHSLMRICSKTDLLMIGLLRRPQQDSHVISFFIQKDDRSVISWSAAAWLESRYAVCRVQWALPSSHSFSGCRELGRLDIKKKNLILFRFRKYSQITFRTNSGAMLSLFLLAPSDWQATEEVIHRNTDTQGTSRVLRYVLIICWSGNQR